MALLLRTRELLALLQSQDPGGERIVQFHVSFDIGDDEIFEVYAASATACLKGSRQTEEGDREILRLRLDAT